MKATFTLLCIYFYALLSSGRTSSDDDRRWLSSLIELVELDYEDHCEQRATATWSELTGSSKGLSLKLVSFGDTAMNKLRFATDYDCGTSTNCTLRELHNSLAKQHDEATLRRMKESWEKKLPNLNDYLVQILPLLRNASKENSYSTVEEYWNSLGEYEGAILKAREIWDRVKPLYEKLHKYVALRLKGTDAVGKPLPVYLLRSLTGDDWSNVIESLLPKHADIYQKVYANLQLKDLGGLNAFHEASKLLEDLNMPAVEPYTWDKSIFNSSCPPVLVDWCKPNKLRVVSCKDVTISNYIDAHDVVMKIKYKEIAALHSNNTYTLREANRYSAIYEAIPGFASLLALNPHALNRSGLYPIERFNYNPNYHRLVLQLITALQTSDADILGHSYIVHNKPLIGKFMGLILKYQIYQSFAEELISDESDLIKHISENNDRLLFTMSQGYGSNWPEMVSDLLAKRENGLEYTGLTDYYRLLDEYLDNQLDPSVEITDSDYVEPIITEPEVVDNEIPVKSETLDEKPKTHEDINENVIDTGDEGIVKAGGETSTVGVLEIKNPVASGDQGKGEINVKEASYNAYWWIGVGVAVAIVVLLIAIITRKRQNHKKQLDRQRRETHA
ncbi:hypothetical protein MSG28_007978 [Choristoneura fumiferana]|uniref:Uncharacterized protein n=1 Tax=Choristoneura fumiferana TaxID=7141 RepID=A0ACC0J9T4_CHOFU|nr:hypothetical protein MSG28_007978 [Choristoneura fumiferana]